MGRPVLIVLTYWKSNDRFIRCLDYRDWQGRDVSGSWSGPTPKWTDVAETGHCGQCAAQLIIENGPE